jgi:hypothetical protein
MLDQHLSYDYSYTYFRTNSKGGIVTDKTWQVAGSLIGKREKESIDTGEFVPGVYRINPYYVHSTTYNCAEVAWSLEAPEYTYPATWTVLGQFSAPILAKIFTSKVGRADFGNLADRAYLRAQSNLNGSQAGMAENLGELKETLSMLRNPFGSAREFLFSRNYRRLGLLEKIIHWFHTERWLGLSKRKAAKAAADAWLEFRYGFMPLCRSIQDIIDLAEQKKGKFDPSKIRSSKSHLCETQRDKTVLTDLSMDTKCGLRVEYERSTEARLDLYATIHYRLAEANGVFQELGLTPEFLPELAWELTRASFVVDWWLEIGAWLGAMRIKPYVEVLGHTIGYREHYEANLKPIRIFDRGTATKPLNGDFGDLVIDEYTRDVSFEPSLVPQFTQLNPLDLYRELDLLALIYQPIAKRLRSMKR